MKHIQDPTGKKTNNYPALQSCNLYIPHYDKRNYDRRQISPYVQDTNKDIEDMLIHTVGVGCTP